MLTDVTTHGEDFNNDMRPATMPEKVIFLSPEQLNKLTKIDNRQSTYSVCAAGLLEFASLYTQGSDGFTEERLGSPLVVRRLPFWNGNM